jgi:hypothetical protein
MHLIRAMCADVQTAVIDATTGKRERRRDYPRAAPLHLQGGGLLCFDGEGCRVLIALIDIADNVRQLGVVVLHT